MDNDKPVFNEQNKDKKAKKQMGSSSIDRLSTLPPEILKDIISRLDLGDAGRTSILSKAFRSLWQESHSLKITTMGHNTYPRIVTQKFYSFHMDLTFLQHEQTQGDILMHWLQLMNIGNVEHIDISVAKPRKHTIFRIPAILYQTSSLVTLCLGCTQVCQLPEHINLPNLKLLQQGIGSPEGWDSVSNLITRCPILETLRLEILMLPKRNDPPPTDLTFVCSHQNLLHLQITGGIYGLQALQECTLRLQLSTIEEVNIHLNKALKLVWIISPTKMKVKEIKLPPVEVFEDKKK